MGTKKMSYGNVPEEVLKQMKSDYLTKAVTLKSLADHYHLAIGTVKQISRKYDWKKGRKEYSNRYIKKATHLRAQSAQKIIGQMMDVFERHSENILLESRGQKPINIIPVSVTDQAYKLMGYMDKIYNILKAARENATPDAIVVEAPGLDYENIEERYHKASNKGREQLEEWEASRNPSIKDKESEDVFDAQAPAIEPPKEEDIVFEGLEDDSKDDSPIGGILD